MRRQTILAAVSAIALFSAVPALAQSTDAPPVARLEVGTEVRGALTADDRVGADDEYRYDVYRFQAAAGQRLDFTLRAEDFDAYLAIYEDGQDEALASDDDGLGGGTDSRLRFTATRDGDYLLHARTLSGLEGGDYTLTLTERPPAAPAPEPGTIALGQTRDGTLADDDAETDDGGHYDAYVFTAEAGQRFTFDLVSDAFDPVVRVGRMEGEVFTELAMNDDGPDTELNSRLIFTAPEAGTYVVRATALSDSGTGDYKLSLSEGPAPIAATAIAIGDTVEGELSEDDGRSADGYAADRYRFEGREGQRVRIDMTAPDFDSYLELFDDAEASLATDDDGGPEGLNARINFTLPRTGSYVIQARGFSDATGDYTLKVSEIEPDRPPQPLAFGATVQGEIGETDNEDGDGRHFEAYSFTATEGQRIRAIMRSGDFDTYLQIGNAEGDFSMLASDDDGLGEGTDSRLDFAIPEDGTYVVRASPLGSEGEGLYSLELIDRGPQPKPGSLLVGSTARGTLTETDATAADNSFYDAYRVTLKEDEELVLTMVSNEFDSVVFIGRDQEDGEFEVLGSDDDSLSDTHAKLEWKAPADGTYEIRAGSFAQGQTGSYALTVEKKP
ncbi:PPC domain-containing protein [uncultured Brevundimonas sp.]|uniref:PPC domain-containing protein n=1 Tax=uncultured Brevundimonas sp. TaxID=213418 RepID=UPI0025E324F7|nr:PPC domain-containing protein [uncultured Brevundimonas sp.]